MAKKKKAVPRKDDYCRNKVSGRIHKVTKLGAFGWFQLDGGPGWSQWCYYTPVPRHIAEKELVDAKEKGK